MKFLINLNNVKTQTADIKGALKNDWYVCAWANDANNFGLYNVGKNNPEDCQ